MAPYMKEDEHGRSTICSLYLDTPDYLLIRRSMDHPVYKEKLRLRSYGVAKEDTTVFLELKKKYDSVVYKRRIAMPLAQAEQFLAEETAEQKGRLCRISPDSRQSQRSEIDRQQSIASEKDQPVNTGIVRINPQIRNEIHYCMQNYHDLHPAVLLTYERGREVGYFYSRVLAIVFLLRKRYRQCDRSHSPLRIRELPASLFPEEDRQTLDRIVKPEMGTVRLMDVLVGI